MVTILSEFKLNGNQIHNFVAVQKTLLDGWMEGWKDGWVGGKAGLRIAYSNQKFKKKPRLKKLSWLTKLDV